MEELTCNWTPQLIVELIKSVVWPLTLLLIGLKFRSCLIESIRNFFSKNTVAEVSATASGVSAKFVAAKQSTEPKESGGRSAISLPQNMSVEAIREVHEQNKTDFSEELYRAIKTHLSFLELNTNEQVEMLAKEASLLQSTIRYFDINKALFRSQFNLFSIMKNHSGYVSKNDLQHHFLEIKNLVGEAYIDWDWIK